MGGKFVILYFGKIKKTKGIEDLCKAFCLLKRRTDASLIIGGSTAASENFGNYLRQEYPDVIFTGFVDDPRALYEAADVFSINTPGFQGGESFSIALAEAMSMELPVVCSDNPIFREVTRGNAIFAPPQNPEALAEKLLEVADSPSHRLYMGQKGRTLATNLYDTKVVVDRLVSAYSSQVA